MQLRDEDIARLDSQGWAAREDGPSPGRAPYVEFRGRTWLRQREDGACIFLQDDGLCRIHAEFGFEKKPLACQLFPFTLMPVEGGVQVGMSFACPSVINNRGAALESHLPDIRRFVRALPDVKHSAAAVRLTSRIAATKREVEIVTRALDRLLSRQDLPMETRLDGACWLTGMLRQARTLKNMRGERLEELFDVLLGAIPQELGLDPPAPPTRRQEKMLRQAVFAHVEDVKIGQVAGRSIRGRAWRQLWLNFRWGRGRGSVPPIEWGRWNAEPTSQLRESQPTVEAHANANGSFSAAADATLRFEAVNTVAPADDERAVEWIDSLLERYVRTRLLGGRTFGAGYYGFDIVTGLEALWLMLTATGWLSRLHAAAHGRSQLAPLDIEAALLRTDRAAGRAPWLGSPAERLRLAYLAEDQGLRRLRHAWRMTDGSSQSDHCSIRAAAESQ